MTRNWVSALLVPLAFAGAVGCAEERDPINRVQPNALAKSFYVGEDLVGPMDDPEFWYQGSLIDVGYGAAQDGLFTSTWAQATTRLKWQITEDLLIGRASYELIPGSDGKGDGAHSTDGQVAVAFAIQSHFDIRRDYNPSTGEELNVIDENATDRPWYERQYFRVDWSQNLNTDAYDFDTLALMGIYGGVAYEPMAYYVNDPNDPDAPYFDVGTGYFDLTTKAYATPKLIDLSAFGWGIDKFPACYLDADFMNGSAPNGNCNPVEITVRHSFRRVVDSDYEPMDWDGYRFASYGAFYKDRYGYSRNYGMSDDLWHRFIQRYNIWERSHYYQDPANMAGPVACFTPETTPYGADPHRDTNGNGTDDECQAVADITGFGGSRCDTFKQKCTLPYRLRVPKPLAWYYSAGSDANYFEGTEWATHDWDVALRKAVAIAQYAECVSTTPDAAACAAQYPAPMGQQDDNMDLVQVAREVDDCRHGLNPNVAANEDACKALADGAGAARGARPQVIELAKRPEMIVLCHSPVEANDPPACGGPRLPADLTAEACTVAQENHDMATMATCRSALFVRMGDLRYHLVNVITRPQDPSAWGIMVDATDPTDGEKISASINVWSYVNDLWSQGVIDRVRLMSGELDVEDVTEAEYVHDYAQAVEAAERSGVAGHLTLEQKDARIAAFSKVTPETLTQLRQNPQMLATGPEATKLFADLTQVKMTPEMPSVMAPKYHARQTAVAGTATEAELITPEMQQYAGIDNGMPMGDGTVAYASPLRGMNPSFQRQLTQLKENAIAARGACVLNEAPAPMSMTGLSAALKAKFTDANSVYYGKRCNDSQAVPADQAQACRDEQATRAERMRKYLAQRAQYAVIVHEMGHSIGLRHNFISSSDAFNYQPQYWQLRTDNGTNNTLCTSYDSEGSCVGPRYFDPVTDNERDNLIWMWMQSSVMDYAGETTQDMIGLGAYDFAAAAMFYGEAVAVSNDPSAKVGSNRAAGLLWKMDNFGGITGIRPLVKDNGDPWGYRFLNYSALQKEFKLIDPASCAQVDPNIFRPASWDDATLGAYHPVIDGLVVSTDGGTSYSRCRQVPVDYQQWQRLHVPTTSEQGIVGQSLYYAGGASVDATQRIRWPYGFATDSWADLGNASVYRHDNGADVYEIFNFLATQQEVNHIFDSYRRGKQSFSVRRASSRIRGRYNEKIRDGAKGLTLFSNVYKDFAAQIGFVFDGGYWPFIADKFYDENVLASTYAFDFFTRLQARPEAGRHSMALGVFSEQCAPGQATCDSLLTYDEGASAQTLRVIVPNGAGGSPFGDISIGGKPLENQLSSNHGEYDRDYTLNAGSYYDKAFNAMMLTESVDNFISSSRDDFYDPRYRATSIADLFPDGYRRWLGNNLTGDEITKAPVVAANTDGGMPITDAQKYPTYPIGWPQYWGATIDHCFPAAGTNMCGYLDANNVPFGAQQPPGVTPLDPQVGWAQQVFLINWTLMYLPENQKQNWINQISLWMVGHDSDPGFQNRIEFHDPFGKVFVAKTFGKETYFAGSQYERTVQKGVAARVLEYANRLLEAAYEVSDGPDLDNDGTPDWFVADIDQATGEPHVKWSANMQFIDANGNTTAGIPGCNSGDNTSCTCAANAACVALQKYLTVPYYLRQAIADYSMGDPDLKGIYDAP
ncbi:MAG: hypothetical protein IT373_08160 [Polyangiaceae bacterium]|nr:hypothetical protein [Polyangiaceae bacterium]